MICPQCRRSYPVDLHAVCPACGFRVRAGVVRTTAVLISTAAGDARFRCVSEVPEPLKDRLIESTSGVNGRTIVIADRRLLQGAHREGRTAPRWLLHATGGLLFTCAAGLIWFVFR